MNNKLIKKVAVPFFALALISFLGFCLITNSAGTLRIYFPSDLPFVYRLNQSIPQSYIAPIEAGANVWNDIEASYFEFQRGENTTATSVSRDGINLVFFDLQGVNFSNPNVIAFSSTFSTGGQGFKAYESDLIWNARDFPPAVTGIGGIDLQGTIAHEFGHHMGIDHTGLPSGASSGCGPFVQAATMWYAVSQNDTTQRSLHPEDIIAATYLYPNWIIEGTIKNAATNTPIEDMEVKISNGYAAQVGAVENPIGNRFNRAGLILTSLPTNENGYYKSVVTNREFNITIDGYGYPETIIPVSFNIPSGFGNTQTLTFNTDLQPNSIVSLDIDINDTTSNLPVDAEIDIFWEGDHTTPLETVNTTNGQYSFSLPSDEYFKIVLRMALPYPNETVYDSVYLPNGGNTFNINLSPSSVLLVLTEESAPIQTRYDASIKGAGKPYRLWKLYEDGNTIPSESIDLFSKPLTIIWVAGGDTSSNISGENINLLKNNLRMGNNLVLAGKNVVEFLSDDSLLANYAGVTFNGNFSTFLVRGIAGDVIGDGIAFSSVGPFKDIMDISSNGMGKTFRSLQYGTAAADTMKISGARFENSNYKYKGFVLGFGFESIGSVESAIDLMDKILIYCADTTFSVTNIKDELITPIQYSLEQNYPNPFNPATNIKFSIPVKELVSLKIYNSIGEEVEILVNNELNAGYYSVNFNASKFASGVYYYRINAGSYSETRKMILIK